MKKLAIAVVATMFNGAMIVNGFGATELTKLACAAGPVSSTGVIGRIIQSKGDVLYSGATGYTNAKPGAKLVSGSQISVGEGASAKISVGSNCNLPIGENSIATLNQPNGASGDILVSISNILDAGSDAVQEGLSTQAAGGLGLALVGGGVAGGAAAGSVGTSVQNGDKNPVKQATNNSDFVSDGNGGFISVSGGENVASQ